MVASRLGVSEDGSSDRLVPFVAKFRLRVRSCGTSGNGTMETGTRCVCPERKPGCCVVWSCEGRYSLSPPLMLVEVAGDKKN